MTARTQQAPVYIGRLDSRINVLENQNATTITEFWESIPSGTTSGTLSPEAGHEFVENQWEDGVDAVVTGITGGVPNLQPVYEADGLTLVTATLNTTTGAWAFSGEPAGADPVALVTAQRFRAPTLTARSLQVALKSASALTTGVKTSIVFPVTCTITGVKLFGNGAAVLDLWRDSEANYPPTVADSICAAAKPTLAGAGVYTDTTLTGWTKSITAGDILRVSVDSATATELILIITTA